MKKGALTTSAVIRKLAERMDITEKQAEILYDNFVDTVDMAANYTDALAIRFTHVGVLYLPEKGLWSKMKETKERLAASTDKDNQLKLEEQINWLEKKMQWVESQRKMKDKKFANRFNSILENIISSSRLSRAEVAQKQNEYKRIKENK